MPAILQEFLHRHIYSGVLLATFVEGMGLPLPAEVLFVAAAFLVRQGHADLGMVIACAVLGNVVGTLSGFAVAYMGGQRLTGRIARALKFKPEALAEVERFFHRYGAATIFMARFVGFIRAATIYTAGAARVAPWKFATFTLAAAVVWNGGWALLAYHFGTALPRVIHRLLGRWSIWVVVLLGILLVGGLVIRWNRRRDPAGP